jgi:hypothetical protein
MGVDSYPELLSPYFFTGRTQNMTTAVDYAQTRDESGYPGLNGDMEDCDDRAQAIAIGVPLQVLDEFEAIRPSLQSPIAQGHYGLDLNNWLWSLMGHQTPMSGSDSINSDGVSDE